MKRLAEGGRVVVFVGKDSEEEAETALSPVVPTAKFASLRTAIVGRSPETELREEYDSTFARAPSHGTENTEAGSRRSATSNTGGHVRRRHGGDIGDSDIALVVRRRSQIVKNPHAQARCPRTRTANDIHRCRKAQRNALYTSP